MSKDVSLWNKVVSAALRMPGVAVDRDKYLRDELGKFFPEQVVDYVIERGTPGVIPTPFLDKLAAACIKSHTKKATLISTAMGIPGGLAVIGTVPADLAQFYFHVLVMAQKLAYLYGYPTLLDERGHLSQGAVHVLTIFVGVMTGVGVAAKALQELGEMLQKQILKKLPEYALSNGVLYPVVRKVAAMIGASLSKDTISKGVTKAIPLVSGVISGAITYRTFKPQARRLSRHLRNNMLLPQHVAPGMAPPPPPPASPGGTPPVPPPPQDVDCEVV